MRKIASWWLFAVFGVAIAVLIAWASHAVQLSGDTLLTALVTVLALFWLVTLVTGPWNLYFAARRAAASMAVSRERGIDVRPANDAEAARLSRWMLRFALGAHAGTALVAAAIAYATGNKTGYYLAGVFLVATVFRPAAAYFHHVRERITALTRESTHPRDDVVTLRKAIDQLRQSAAGAELSIAQNAEALGQTETRLADSIAHNRDLLVTDLNRLRDTQQQDGRQIDQLVRRIEATLDGISDHQELLAGLHALVRMVRES